MAETSRPSRARRVLRLAAYVYLLLLVASQLWWRLGPEPVRPEPSAEVARLATVTGVGAPVSAVEVAYTDLGPRSADTPVLVLLHGSPGSLQDFRKFAGDLEGEFRVVVPDLPGFGDSERDIPDYSARAHSVYVEQLLDHLGVERAHLVAFSMGGAVAAEFGDRSPERVASMSFVAAIGVVELELFGDQELNHLIHAAQLVGIQALRQLWPHFGGADRWVLGVPYARNFYDTDQGRIRGCLERWAGPYQVIHGEADFLVPVEAARENARIVPQSEFVELDASHFVLWTRPAEVAALVANFVRRSEAGSAPVRATAPQDRVTEAALPFDPSLIPPASGPALLVLMLLFIVGTFVSEDLTTIAAGLMVAQGRVEFVPAAFACALGVYVGDLGLFLAGRWLGRPIVERPPMSWMLTPAALERASDWFERQGIKTIFLSRLMPGLRLPTYFAAGLLRTRFASFALYFLIAVAVWTPILVGFAAWIGDEAGALIEEWGLAAGFALLVAILVVERVVIRLFTWRGRRSLRGAWLRWTRWEFWPPWLFYPPVVLYIGWLALRHRSFALVTAVNPCMPTGGFIGEEKSKILDGIDNSAGLIADYVLLRADASPEDRRAVAREFQASLAVAFPIVLKPEVGQRGSGVRVLKDVAGLEEALEVLEVDHVLQAFAPGPEYGVFYVREPGAERGRIFSITEKQIPTLAGDGVHTLEELIWNDPRSVALASTYLQLHTSRLQEVLEVGEEVPLVELGSHCRGAVFLDGNHLRTQELEDTIEALSQSYDGFWFGRYDLRAESEAAFREGRGFKILELNGLTSEATHIYDPKTPLLEAWRVLCQQWRLAFEIAAANRDAGARPDSLGSLLRAYLDYRRDSRSHRN